MKVQVFGHPYASIGMSEQMLSFCRAMDEVYLDYRVSDIYGINSCVDTCNSVSNKLTTDYNWGGIRVFHINGDEVQPCLSHLKKAGMNFEKGYNIIIPAWELPSYPVEWRESVNKFDEIWALSHFIEKIFSQNWVTPTVRYVGQAAERELGLVYPRKYFGIKDSSLVFLSFFDQSSYIARKNPYAVLELYEKLRKELPYSDFQLVLKAKNIDAEADLNLPFIDEQVVIINKNLTQEEITSLIDCCDVFISLHRSEGFGRGGAEALLRGRRALLTAYSGVEDYCSDPAVIPVDYSLVNVNEGEYPFSEGQKWAEPDISDAFKKTKNLILDWEKSQDNYTFFRDNPIAGDVVRRVASNFNVGLNILRNLEKISHCM